MNSRSSRGQRSPDAAPLSRDEVVGTALRIIDERGLHELTMRALARELGVFPAAVYWHAGTKAEVLALVSDRVLAEIEPPDAALDWQDWFLELGLRVRRILGAHPRFASYFVTNIQVSGRMLVLADAAIGTLARAGFRDEELVEAYNALFGTAFNWAAGEFAEDLEAPGADVAEIEALRAAVPVDTLPHLNEHWSVVANRVYGVRWSSGRTQSMASSYERVLRTLIAGFARRLDV